MANIKTPNKLTVKDNSIYKMIFAIIITIIMFALLPKLIEDIGWTKQEPIENASFVLIVTGISLIVKVGISNFANNEFFFYKFGYDNCIITFGGTLTALALQLSSTNDLFPGLASTPLNYVIPKDISLLSARQAQIFLLLILSMTAMIITAIIARSIKENKVKIPNLLAILNTVVGLIMLGIYLNIIILKG